MKYCKTLLIVVALLVAGCATSSGDRTRAERLAECVRDGGLVVEYYATGSRIRKAPYAVTCVRR